jgi:hypothetical protein
VILAISPRLLAGALSTALLAGTLVAVAAVPASAAVTTAAGCAPVAIVAFRGSGEKNVDDGADTLEGTPKSYGTSGIVTNGWEGPTLTRLIEAYSTTARGPSWPADFDVADVPILSIGYDGAEGYPAVTAEAKRTIFQDLVDSSGKGAIHAVKVMNEFAQSQTAGCNTKFITTGYSQGAMAARVVAQLSPTTVAGVIDFGDPYQLPDATGNEGDAADGEGIVRWWLNDEEETVDKFYDLSAHKTALCHEKDPICSYSWLAGLPSLKFAIDTHLNYLDKKESSVKAAELANLAASLTKEKPPAPTRAALETVFVIDTTGSMGGYIDAAKETARQAAAAVFASAGEGRVGLVEYRDHGDAFVARDVVGLTTSSDEFSAGLDTLYAGGGGDWPESMSSGIFEAVRSDWTPAASKSVVVIADAPAHDPEPVTNYTLAQVANVLGGREAVPAAYEAPASRLAPGTGADRNQEPGLVGDTDSIAIPEVAAEAPPASRRAADATASAAGFAASLYVITPDVAVQEQTAPIVAATGGKVFGINDPSELADTITDAIGDTTTAPEARLSVAGTALTGIPVLFSAAESSTSSAERTFDFDQDGDGNYETLEAGPALSVTYSTAGEHTVNVRVTDDRGRVGFSSAVVTVRDQSAAVRTVPDPDDEATGLTDVTLSSTFTSAEAPATVTVGDTLASDELLGARLVVKVPGNTPADNWDTEAAAVYSDVTLTGERRELEIPPGSLAAGEYALLVFTDQGKHASLSLTVRPDEGAVVPLPTPSNTPPSSPTPAPSSTPTPGPGAAPTPEPTEAATPVTTPTPDPTDAAVPAATPTPDPTDAAVPAATPTPKPTEAAVPAATPTPKPTEAAVPAATPTPKPTEAAAPAASPAPGPGTAPTEETPSADTPPAGVEVLLSPATVDAGSDVTVTASGLEPDEAASIWVSSTPLKPHNATANASGRLNVTITIPTTLPAGDYRVEARLSENRSAWADLKVTAPSKSSTSASSGYLARTGVDPRPPVLGGIILLLLGGCLLVVVRRRTRARAS